MNATEITQNNIKQIAAILMDNGEIANTSYTAALDFAAKRAFDYTYNVISTTKRMAINTHRIYTINVYEGNEFVARHTFGYYEDAHAFAWDMVDCGFWVVSEISNVSYDYWEMVVNMEVM